jgi:hypothetical protein
MRDRARWFQSLSLQQSAQPFAKFARRGLNHPRRDFFASDFQ